MLRLERGWSGDLETVGWEQRREGKYEVSAGKSWETSQE